MAHAKDKKTGFQTGFGEWRESEQGGSRSDKPVSDKVRTQANELREDWGQTSYVNEHLIEVIDVLTGCSSTQRARYRRQRAPQQQWTLCILE